MSFIDVGLKRNKITKYSFIDITNNEKVRSDHFGK